MTTLIRERYEPLGVVGRGGQGEVVRALDRMHDRQVALKVRPIGSEAEREALLREARLLLGIKPHPNLPLVREDFVTEDRYYLVMDWIEGRNLRRVLDDEGLPGLPFDRVLGYLSQVADALDHLHDQDVVHRDVKPANLILTPDGRVVLVDFGISTSWGASDGDRRGTADFAAPELVTGALTPAADVYGLAVTAYTLLSGAPPRPEVKPALAGLPGEAAEGVLRAVRRGLTTDPSRRPPSAGALIEAIRAGARGMQATEPLVEPARAERELPPCPYRGLFAFREEDTAAFFGREAVTDELVRAVGERSLVALIGASGSGKSSVVQAGLVPALRARGGWAIASLRPGDRPFHSLAAALLPLIEPRMSETDRIIEVDKLADAIRERDGILPEAARRARDVSSSQRLLLVVDQFEELYTLARAEDRMRFLDRLLAVVRGEPGAPRDVGVVLTLRADFVGNALSHRPFADALQHADLKLGPMNREELQSAIEKPAAALGVRIEDGLTERILEAVADEPGSLPLLEFALTQLWTQQADGQLTHAAYDAMGGVEHALAGYAEEFFADLGPDEQARAQRVLLQLVRPGEGTEDTRRLATRTEVGEENWSLVGRLASARLVVSGRAESTDQESVEIVHEALIGTWGRLRDWMESDRTFRGWQERLRASMRQWEASGRDDGALLRGAPLAEARGWLEQRRADLSSPERAYIGASLGAQERAEQERETARQLELEQARALAEEHRLRAEAEHARAAQQARYARLQRSGAAVLAVLLVIAVAGAALAWGQRNESHRLRLVSVAQAMAAQVNTELDFRRDERAALLARQAFLFDRETGGSLRTEVDRALRSSLDARPFSYVLSGQQGSISSLAFAPDGNMLASGGGDMTVWLWNVRAPGRAPVKLKGLPEKKDFGPEAETGGGVTALAFSPDGKRLAAGSQDNAVRVWDLARPSEAPLVLAGHGGEVRGLAWRDAATLASASADSTIRIWTVAGGAPNVLRGHTDGVRSVAYGAGGVLASAGADGIVRLWRASGGSPAQLRGHEGAVFSVAFSGDGRRLVSAGEDQTVRVWDPSRLAPSAVMSDHAGAVHAAAVSGTPLRIASGGEDKSVFLWNTTDPSAAPAVLGGHTGIIYSMAFSTDGRWVASGAGDKTVRVWDIAPPTEHRRVWRAHDGSIGTLAFSRDGKRLASGAKDAVVRVWDVAGRAAPIVLMGHEKEVKSVAFSPDGERLASASLDGTVRVWDPSNPRAAPVVVTGHQAEVFSVVFSPDGKTLASAGGDKMVRLWRVPELRQVAVLAGHTGDVKSVAFSPDGTRLASGGGDTTVRLWDIRRPSAAPMVLEGHENEVDAVAFSPDGDKIASSGDDRTVQVRNTVDGTKAMEPLLGHLDEVETLAWARDGKTLVSGSDDNTVRVWDIHRRSSPLVLGGHTDEVEAVAVSPDGLIVASSGDDETIALEPLSTEMLADLVCERVWRNLTAKGEWREFAGPGITYRRTCPDRPAA